MLLFKGILRRVWECGTSTTPSSGRRNGIPDLLGLIAAIYREAGKQETVLQRQPEALEKLVEIAMVQSTEASNAIEGIVTTNARLRQLVAERPRRRIATNRRSPATGTR